MKVILELDHKIIIIVSKNKYRIADPKYTFDTNSLSENTSDKPPFSYIVGHAQVAIEIP